MIPAALAACILATQRARPATIAATARALPSNDLAPVLLPPCFRQRRRPLTASPRQRPRSPDRRAPQSRARGRKGKRYIVVYVVRHAPEQQAGARRRRWRGTWCHIELSPCCQEPPLSEMMSPLPCVLPLALDRFADEPQQRASRRMWAVVGCGGCPRLAASHCGRRISPWYPISVSVEGL